MAEKIGIELVLKQNLEAQLKTILPILTRTNDQFNNINKTLLKMQELHNKATQGFNRMASSMDLVTKKERGLQNVNSQISKVGSVASSSTRMVDGLAMSLGAVVKTVGPLLLAMKGLQALTAGVGAGLDFQSEVIALKRKGFSDSEVNSIKNYALSSSASGKTVLTPMEQMEAAGGALPILGHANVRAAMPEYNRMATMFKGAKVDLKSPEVLSRFWELSGVKRDSKSIEKLDNALYRVSVASGIPLSQLLYQYNMYGAGAIGRDFEQSLTEVAYFAKESGAGLAGAGGGRGRAGNIARAMDAMISGGKMSQATIQMMYEQGRFPGLDKYVKHHAGGRGLLYNDANGQIVNAHSGGRTVTDTLHITQTAFKEYLAKERGVNPGLQWMENAGASEDVAVREYTIMAARAMGMTGSPTDMINKFHALPGVRQKQAFSNFIGSNVLTNTGIMQYGGIGQYQTNVKNFKDTVAGVPLPGDAPQSIEQQWAEFSAQMTAFATNLMNTPQMLNLMNASMKVLIDYAAMLNANVGKIADFFFGGKTIGQEFSGSGAAAVLNKMGIPSSAESVGPNRGRLLWKGMQQTAGSIFSSAVHGPVVDIITQAAKKYGVDPRLMLAMAQQESGMNPLSIGDHGTSFGLFQLHKGGALGNMSPAQAFNPWINAENTASRISKMHGQYNSPGALAAAAQRPLNPSTYARSVNNLYVTLNNETKLDSKTIAKHTTNHVAKAMVRSGNKMSQAASASGGSYTPGSLNNGGGQSN